MKLEVFQWVKTLDAEWLHLCSLFMKESKELGIKHQKIQMVLGVM
jgi:hypothetical protein